MALVCADHTHHTFAADDLAVAADFFDRSRNSHFILQKTLSIRSDNKPELGALRTEHPKPYRTPARRWRERALLCTKSTTERRLEVGFLEQRLVLLTHHVVLYLCHEVHGNHHNDQQRRTTEIERHVVLQDQKLW